MSSLDRNDYADLAFDFHLDVNNEDMSSQARPNIWRTNIKSIMHSASSVDYTIEPESSIETAWYVFGNSCIKSLHRTSLELH